MEHVKGLLINLISHTTAEIFDSYLWREIYRFNPPIPKVLQFYKKFH